RRGQDAARHPRHAVIAGVVRDEEGTETPELRKLLAVEARRAEEAGDEHDGQRFRRHPGLPRWLCPALGHLAGRSGGALGRRLFGDAEVDQLTNGHRRFERGEAFVDLSELQPPGDQMIELQPPLAPQGQQAGHVDPEPVAAHGGPLQFAIALMRSAPARAAPLTSDSPTPPQPITATVEPGSTLAALNTAPTPVTTPQPTSAARSSGISGSILTTACSCTSICSAKEERFRNWCITSPPFQDRRRETPGSSLTSVFSHRL